MRSHAPVLLTLYACALAFSLFANAQDVQSTADRILALGQSGKWDEALLAAKNAFNACPAGAEGTHCRVIMSYCSGFLEQKRGETLTAQTGARQAFLSARRWYETSLKDDPDNGPVLFNLALLSQGEGAFSDAVTLLRRAIAGDPLRAPEYGVKMGDILVQSGDLNSAWSAYEDAAKYAPGSDTPRWRLVDLMERVPDKLVGMQSTCASWETSFPDVAAECYRAMIVGSYRQNPSLAEQSFLSWLALLAQQEHLTEDSLKSLPPEWNGPQVADVAASLHGSLPATIPVWWLASPSRRKAFAGIMLLEGHRFASRGPAFVESCWLKGLQSVQHVSEPGATMPGTPAVTINLYREMALLYIRYPDFDAGQTKFNRLITEIFDVKGQAIASHNLEAEQSFHTVLGIIFAQQKNWGAESNPRTAAYQLLRTIDVANQRYKEEGIYQPLPEIKELQARVYQATARPDKAGISLWNAALAYMDSDELAQAERIIGEVPEGAGQDKSSLLKVLQIREAAASGSAAADVAAKYQSISTAPGLDDDFIQRQRFKVLGDLVASSSDVNDSAALQHALDAVDLAANKRIALVGVGDLKRWETVQHRVVLSVGGQAKSGLASPGANGPPLKLSMPGRTAPQNVEVPATTLRAAQIATVLRPETVVQLRPQLHYDGRKIVLPAEQLRNIQLQQRLKATGVKAVPQ